MNQIHMIQLQGMFLGLTFGFWPVGLSPQANPDAKAVDLMNESIVSAEGNTDSDPESRALICMAGEWINTKTGESLGPCD